MELNTSLYHDLISVEEAKSIIDDFCESNPDFNIYIGIDLNCLLITAVKNSYKYAKIITHLEILQLQSSLRWRDIIMEILEEAKKEINGKIADNEVEAWEKVRF